MSENGEIYTAGKNFKLPQAVTAWTNSTSGTSKRNKNRDEFYKFPGIGLL